MKHALMLICALLMIAGFALVATDASDAALTPALAHLARMAAMVSMMRGSLAATCGVCHLPHQAVRALPRGWRTSLHEARDLGSAVSAATAVARAATVPCTEVGWRHAETRRCAAGASDRVTR